MKPYCCSQISTTFLNLASTSLSHSFINNQTNIMNPETPDPQELLATVAQHESTVQRLEAALAQQETLMATHTDLMTSIRQIFDRLPSTSATASAASVPPPDSPMPSPLAEPRLPPPQRFSGDPSACDGFLTQCSLTFELQPSSFPSDRAKIAYVITLLSGKALSWATAVWKAQAPFCSSYTRFVEEFKRVFDHPLSGRQASKNLLTLRQKNGSATEYAIQFRTIAAGSGWNDESLMVCFLNGLSEAIKDDLAIREPARDLDNLIDQAIRLDNRLRERNLNRPCVSALSASPTPAQMLPVPQNSLEPMQLALDGRPLAPGKITHLTSPLDLSTYQHQERICFHLIQSPEFPVILGYPWLLQHNPHLDWSTGTVLSWGSTCQTTCMGQSSPDPVLESQESLDLSQVPIQYHHLKAVFSKKKATSLPPHRPYDCAIELLLGTCPPRGRIFSLSPPERTAMDKYINESLAAGVIRSSTSPAGAGFFFVSKKDGGLRPCIDYRGLNKITLRNRYPLPLMATAFEILQEASIFTKLDLRNAYHLVRIRQGDEWKTAFNTPTGHYEYLVMPFGLTNAPAVFQALINNILRDMLDQFVFVYLDDILIFSSSLQEHVIHVSKVLRRLLDNHLYVKPEKLVDWPSPSSIKEVQRFLGFANFYRKFIRNFSSVAAPLSALTKGNTAGFHWGPEAELAFNKLKCRFTSAPILILPNPEIPFTVEVDASDVGVGAVLSQRGADNKLHPCAFLSHRLTPTERNYHVGDQELLAVKLSLEEWRHWLEGAKHPFQVLTDHKNLEYIQQAKRLNPRQARWSLFFNRFQFILSYRPGSKNLKPDALSRGNTVIMVIVDRFSKAARFVPLPKLPTAKETADLIITYVFRVFGIPQDIVSDRGPQFSSRFWRAFCQSLGASVSLSSGFHPESNGQTERLNQDLETTLRCMAANNPSSWSSFVMWAAYAHNTLRSSATGMSPFECQFGYTPSLFPEQEVETAVPSAQQFVKRCRQTWKRARLKLLKTSQQYQHQANRRRRSAPTLRPGQRVWLSTKNIPLRTESRKLSQRFIGPFKISRKVNPVTYHLYLPKSLKINPTFHVSLLKPVLSSPFLAKGNPPSPRIIGGQPAYTAHRVLDVRQVRGSRQYLVDWEGYGPEERSWVPAKDILDPKLIQEFHARKPSHPGRNLLPFVAELSRFLSDVLDNLPALAEASPLRSGPNDMPDMPGDVPDMPDPDDVPDPDDEPDLADELEPVLKESRNASGFVAR
ncbi:hypothetical protein QTP70_034616 [Hemibagrus guttatus]|uniref:ribonuclease H n=1 Tax=Hemibagrus guttatus TaxID=175788 RepID=A0AAE0QBJ7_9TELE|nr:hypothetical protein QTP70_034616 [Hemibagrus guttatus]